MLRRVMMAGVAALLVASCGQPGGSASSEEGVAAEAAANVEIVPAREAAAPGPAAVEVTVPRIAYVYRYGLEAPADRIPGLMARHEQACAAAGAAVCQVIGSNRTRIGEDDLSAQLELRATPAFIGRMREGFVADAREAGGRVASSTTESEDLTRSLIDAEARLRAQTTLRDRLQGLLATRSGSLEDLLKVETELARVQGEIDADAALLSELRTRVATSRLSIDYTSAGQLAPDSAFRPVVDAVQGAFGAMMTTLSVLITLLAVLLPIALIFGPIVWWWLRRRRAAKAVSPTTPPADQA